MNVLIRDFEPKDAMPVSEVIRQTMRVTNSKDYSFAILDSLIEYYSPEKVLRLAEERICLVAEVERQIVGTIALDNSELHTFFVHPDFQGKGIGIQLIKALEDVAVKNRVHIIRCGSSLSAVSFYEKMDYRKNGLDKEEKAGKQIGMEKILLL